jgi:hypothetical protein
MIHLINDRVFIDEIDRYGVVIGIGSSVGLPIYRVRSDDGAEFRCLGYHLLPIRPLEKSSLRLIVNNDSELASSTHDRRQHDSQSRNTDMRTNRVVP